MTTIDTAPATDYDKLFIGGQWVAPQGTGRIEVFSATTEERIGSVPSGSHGDVDAAVASARAAFDDPTGWSHWTPQERAAAIGRFADEYEKRGAEIGRRVTMENGMPTARSAAWEGGYPPVLLRYFAQMAVDQTEERRPGLFGGASVVRWDPLGVVAAITPWNVPEAISFLKIAPALAAGNTLVLKPASSTVLDAFLMVEAAEAAGLPAGVVNLVPGAGSTLGMYLVEHPGVDKVSFTGSTAVGKAIAEACGRLIRPCTLELGGKSAAVLLDDVDLDSTIQSFKDCTMVNNGQVCWLNSRILIPRSRYDELVDYITDLNRSLVIGDPLDPATEVGPLVSAGQRETVEGYIVRAKADGDRLTTGGGRPKGFDRGWYVEPTIFADVKATDTIGQEEIFGPVLALMPYQDEDEAVRIANDTIYGLGGSVWTADPDRGEAFARRMESGTIGVNAYANDPSAPFGGIKMSGLGRELGPEGLNAMQRQKTIYLDSRGQA